jgi:hypothetical protein
MQPVTCTGLPSPPKMPPRARQRPLAAVILPVRSAAGGAKVGSAGALLTGAEVFRLGDGDAEDALGDGDALGEVDADAEAEAGADGATLRIGSSGACPGAAGSATPGWGRPGSLAGPRIR